MATLVTVTRTNTTSKVPIATKKVRARSKKTTTPKAITTTKRPKKTTKKRLTTTTTKTKTTLHTTTVPNPTVPNPTVPNPTVPNPTPTDLTTTFPTPVSVTTFPTPITIPAHGSFDGKMFEHDRYPRVCREQVELLEPAAMFILEDGATLSNVIIGPNQAEGVHCMGNCILNNVWWIDVCEGRFMPNAVLYLPSASICGQFPQLIPGASIDAATFKQSGGISYINGGGAQHASDKVFQHNGFGTLKIKNFFANDFGKLYRSCGNCVKNGPDRHIVMDNIYALNGTVDFVGINQNYKDTAVITNCKIPKKLTICDLFEGTNKNSAEAKLINRCPQSGDNLHCITKNIINDYP